MTIITPKKYLHYKPLCRVLAKPTNSLFWRGLMNVNDWFFKEGLLKLAMA
jgi:hypothetical protein